MTDKQPVPRRGRPRLKPSTTNRAPADEILLVAAQMFAEVGFDETSFTALAEAVGIQRASLYHHFPNKEAVLLEIGLRWLDPLADLVSVFDEQNEPGHLQLYRYLRIDLRHILSAPYDLGRLFQHHAIRDQHGIDPVWKIVDDIHDAWSRWIGSATDSGDLRAIERRVAGAMVEASYLGVIASDRPGLSDHEVAADQFADLMLAGLLTDSSRLTDLRTEAFERDGGSPIVADVLASWRERSRTRPSTSA